MSCGQTAWNNPYPKEDSNKNIMYSSFSERPKHLDPVRSYSSSEYEFLGQIYEPPLQYHYLKRPYELIPLTAAKMPTLSLYDKDGKPLPEDADPSLVDHSVYTIKIQRGIQFQPHPAFARDESGAYRYQNLTEEQLEDIHDLNDFEHTSYREVTVADYIYQMKRIAQPSLHSPILGIMMQYIVGLRDLAKAIKKEEDARKKQGEEHPFIDLNKFDLSGVKVLDRYTYQIEVKGLYPQLIYWLSMPFFAPMPTEAVKFYSQPGLIEKNIVLDWYPVGTGAYMLSVNNPNSQMVLEKNPNYRHDTYPSEGNPGDKEAGLLKDAGKPMPFIDKVIYNLEKESIPYWNKFLQGYYDVSGVSSESFDQAITFGAGGEAQLSEEMKAKGIKLATAVAASVYYMGFNMMDDVVGGASERARLLRQAIAIAVDYEEYISIFANGRGLPAQGPIPPGIFGYREDEAGINPYVYDWVDGRSQRKPIDYARQLMEKAGYKDGIDSRSGKPLILYYDTTGSGPDSKAVFNWYRKQFKKLDIQLTVRNTDYNRFQDKMLKGTAQIFSWGWNADYPDPENFLFLLYGPNKKVEHNGENAANYVNPEFDRLFNKMKNMP
ncbi:MAG: ABC transporter substrate-binding protein, partial [Gammaproteobacteria bacterium]|nr:ABC transporter substrate-binding protein [Gammaproteobacteria bacterium]